MTNNTPQPAPGGLSVTASQQHFKLWVDGIYGFFRTPAGTMCYLETKARLGGAPSCYTDLTRSLVPAREALEVSQMNFNQLLQRDLDDHRIAKDLIEYVLKPPVTGLPGFFPPIVAVLLPFDSQERPLDAFPSPAEATFETDHLLNMPFKQLTYGQAFRTQFLVTDDHQPNPIHYGVVRWNPENTKLVIIDGQHRAMALLAIERTLSNSWSSSRKGARYEPFYRERVKALIQDARDAHLDLHLDQIEQPVTICWFPNSDVSQANPHKAARKLFVDVNNTARPPSRSRLILLSDTELENVFARELLNKLRDSEWQDKLPLFAVEYDNPRENITTPRRWSVISNLDILKACVMRAVFGPSQIIEKMDAGLAGGRPNWREMDDFMRKRLGVKDLLPLTFDDGPRQLERNRIGHEYFPINDEGKRRKILDAFFYKWGSGILDLLSSVEPYRAHITALKDRSTGWQPGNNIADLAKDALFEGVGMYWTLESEFELWEKRREESAPGAPEPAQTDSARAWILLRDEQRGLFRRRRCEIYLGSASEELLVSCDALYGTLNTYAAQVGLILAWASLHYVNDNTDPSVLAGHMGRLISQALKGSPVTSRDRRLVLLKNVEKPLNMLPRLDQPFAVHFRYFWLELLLVEQNHAELEAVGVNLEKTKELRDKARVHYVKFLVSERAKDVRRSSAELREADDGEARALALATEQIVEEQADAHKHWFGTPKPDARALIRAAVSECRQEDDGDQDANEEGCDEQTEDTAEDTAI